MPIPPNSRRASQQQRDSTAIASPHPYATAPTPAGYRTSAYDNSTPAAATTPNNGYANGNGVDAFNNNNFGSAPVPPIKTGTASGENTMNAAVLGSKDAAGGVRSMAVYDRDQMHSVGEQAEDGHGRKKGFFSALCCF
jgi:casein kinase 1